MQYSEYKTVTGDEKINVIAIRHHWGKENEIYENIENAFVIQMMDHLFLLPINVPRNYIPSSPNIVVDGVFYGFDDSCDFCKNRLQKVTEGCETCLFSPLREENNFNIGKLKNYLKNEEAKPINIAELMNKNDIYQVFYLYHFKNFYDKEMPLTKEAFLNFIAQFEVEILHQNNKEIILKKDDYFYETEFQKNYVEYVLNKTDLEGLKKVYEGIKERMAILKEKEDLLKKILGEI